jgi:PAS domain S-box-containing protein
MSNRILDSDKTKEQLIAELEALRISKEALQQQVTIQSAQLEKLSSEERLSCTILEAPLPIILHAEDGEILKVNQTWTDITGYTHSEIPTIAAWVEKAYGERGEDIKAAISCLYSLDKPQSAGESTITTCWGETRIWDFHCAPFGKTPDGRRLIFTTAFDVTERQQAEAALRESEKRLRLALDATKIGIWDGNVLTHRTTWSSRCEETFGFAPGTFDGTYEAFEACVHPEDRNCVRQSLNHVRESRQDYHQEFRIVWSDGSIHWLESKGKFFYNEAGEAVRILGTAMDISDRKLAEAALQKANEELENRVAQRTAELSQANKRLQWELVERSRVERVLRESESRFRHLFESNVVGVFFADFSGRITDSNELFLQMGGYTWEDLQAGAIRWDEMTHRCSTVWLASDAQFPHYWSQSSLEEGVDSQMAVGFQF